MRLLLPKDSWLAPRISIHRANAEAFSQTPVPRCCGGFMEPCDSTGSVPSQNYTPLSHRGSEGPPETVRLVAIGIRSEVEQRRRHRLSTLWCWPWPSMAHACSLLILCQKCKTLTARQLGWHSIASASSLLRVAWKCDAASNCVLP